MSESKIKHPAVVNLRQYQKPHDPDGVEIGVSRQAVDETLALLEDAFATLSEISRQYENCDMNHVDYRVNARLSADRFLAKAEGRDD